MVVSNVCSGYEGASTGLKNRNYDCAHVCICFITSKAMQWCGEDCFWCGVQYTLMFLWGALPFFIKAVQMFSAINMFQAACCSSMDFNFKSGAAAVDWFSHESVCLCCSNERCARFANRLFSTDIFSRCRTALSVQNTNIIFYFSSVLMLFLLWC